MANSGIIMPMTWKRIQLVGGSKERKNPYTHELNPSKTKLDLCQKKQNPIHLIKSPKNSSYRTPEAWQIPILERLRIIRKRNQPVS